MYKYEQITQIIELYLTEMFKHYNEVELKCGNISKWKDVSNICENTDPANISKAMNLVKFNHIQAAGKEGSTSYTLKYNL